MDYRVDVTDKSLLGPESNHDPLLEGSHYIPHSGVVHRGGIDAPVSIAASFNFDIHPYPSELILGTTYAFNPAVETDRSAYGFLSSEGHDSVFVRLSF